MKIYLIGYKWVIDFQDDELFIPDPTQEVVNRVQDFVFLWFITKVLHSPVTESIFSIETSVLCYVMLQ